MPYIKTERRKALYNGEIPLNVGELNYWLTTQIQNYIFSKRKENYQLYNDIIGVLQCMIQEFYRRKITPYEDKKIKENGDVFR